MFLMHIIKVILDTFRRWQSFHLRFALVENVLEILVFPEENVTID